MFLHLQVSSLHLQDPTVLTFRTLLKDPTFQLKDRPRLVLYHTVLLKNQNPLVPDHTLLSKGCIVLLKNDAVLLKDFTVLKNEVVPLKMSSFCSERSCYPAQPFTILQKKKSCV